LEHVFDRFRQVADKTGGKPVGTGLGLSICKQLVEIMNGRIWAESEVGEGSSFHFTLPLADSDNAVSLRTEVEDGQKVSQNPVA
jgi:signal transduction histidine kinase